MLVWPFLINEINFSIIKLKDKSPGHSDIILVPSTPLSQDISTPTLVSVDLTVWELQPDKCFFLMQLKGQGQGHSDLNLVRNTSLSQYLSVNQKVWYRSYLKYGVDNYTSRDRDVIRSLWPMPFSFLLEKMLGWAIFPTLSNLYIPNLLSGHV